MNVPRLIRRSMRTCSREKARDAIFYSYTKNINGFAANLEPDVAAAIAGEPIDTVFLYIFLASFDYMLIDAPA